jgi:uncharacterized membrane protein
VIIAHPSASLADSRREPMTGVTLCYHVRVNGRMLVQIALISINYAWLATIGYSLNFMLLMIALRCHKQTARARASIL